MIRPFRDEVERYGHYSLAAESMYDHPFQRGSKRTGPDLARVGGRYSNEWHVQHLTDPRAVVPESIMPRYDFLAGTQLDASTITGSLRVNATVGVPYTADEISHANADLVTQASVDADTSGLVARYGANVRAEDFDGNPGQITEMDALIAYLQSLGTQVDFSTYDAEANYR
jgi:cytochrome c oxidase cbb3-type subunit 2